MTKSTGEGIKGMESMKKVGKIIKKYKLLIIGIVLGGIIAGGGVYASTVGASSVSYSNASSEMSATNVQGAIDELYQEATKTKVDGEYIGKVAFSSYGSTKTVPTCYTEAFSRIMSSCMSGCMSSCISASGCMSNGDCSSADSKCRAACESSCSSSTPNNIVSDSEYKTCITEIKSKCQKMCKSDSECNTLCVEVNQGKNA